MKLQPVISSAERIWNFFIDNHNKPDIYIMNRMLYLYATGLRINRTLAFLEKFNEFGVLPTAKTYEIMIQMYTRCNKMERAFDTFNLMKAEGYSPKLRVYALLIFGCARKFYITSGLRLIREVKEMGLPLEPHFHFIINFRRNCVKAPHLIKEIDQLTGKAWQYVPHWGKVGGRRDRRLRRKVTKKEAKSIERSPTWQTAKQEQFAS